MSRPFFFLFSVYFGTYTTANCIDTLHAAKHDLPTSTVSSTTTKFIGTTIVSTSLCVYKDGIFARAYGSSLPRTPVPMISYALFTFRDAITVFASFNLPSLLAPRLTHLSMSSFPVLEHFLGSETRSLKMAQMLCPALCQFVTTPIHLLGLGLHNRRQRIGIRERIKMIRRDVFVATPLRMVRIVPAFGIGNVVNVSLRSSFMPAYELPKV
ncbi:hypothetical protein K491DRAFT_590647 [Lophiostoma macrostomum CBS 122681]|uniref:Sequence orphan n=1 Tax=Lophiostoma macrostomum CBS 122681 TaxID=1314788 RepID=A0A6A6TL80_9PLEO|nr:hypothetical protein K491DRAFT_590647 [Lophiostoma macrostomum CBS 122681]